MFKAAFTPNKLFLLVVFLIAAAGCARLGIWQLERAYERANLAEEHAQAEAASESAVALGEVLKPQTTFAGRLVGKRVQVIGTFNPEQQLLVDGRSVGGEEGFLVLDSLTVIDDGSQGSSWADLSGNPRLPVARGWIPADAVDQSGALTDEWREKLQASTEPTQLTGWLQASESTMSSDLPAGHINSISSAYLANVWGGPMYGGYLVLAQSSEPTPEGLVMLPRPTIEGGDGVNMQNLFYALQWWVFGGFAAALWLRLVRDDAKRMNETTPVNPFDRVDQHT